jgi:hypothetical protein
MVIKNADYIRITILTDKSSFILRTREQQIRALLPCFTSGPPGFSQQDKIKQSYFITGNTIK